MVALELERDSCVEVDLKILVVEDRCMREAVAAVFEMVVVYLDREAD